VVIIELVFFVLVSGQDVFVETERQQEPKIYNNARIKYKKTDQSD
jgi:hypothetical protein